MSKSEKSPKPPKDCRIGESAESGESADRSLFQHMMSLLMDLDLKTNLTDLISNKAQPAKTKKERKLEYHQISFKHKSYIGSKILFVPKVSKYVVVCGCQKIFRNGHDESTTTLCRGRAQCNEATMNEESTVIHFSFPMED